MLQLVSSEVCWHADNRRFCIMLLFAKQCFEHWNADVPNFSLRILRVGVGRWWNRTDNIDTNVAAGALTDAIPSALGNFVFWWKNWSQLSNKACEQLSRDELWWSGAFGVPQFGILRSWKWFDSKPMSKNPMPTFWISPNSMWIFELVCFELPSPLLASLFRFGLRLNVAVAAAGGHLLRETLDQVQVQT